MPMGGGKYEDACIAALIATGGEAVCLVVANGSHGTGFTMGAIEAGYVRALPDILRQCADQIEKDMREGLGAKPH